MQTKNNLKVERKKVRHFSTDFKVEKVQLIEEGKFTVSEISKEYQVTPAAIYKWLDKYSKYHKKSERIIVEKESEEVKNKALKSKIAELERLLGQKEVAISYLEQVITITSEDLGYDVKKKHSGQQ
jgi:transposase